MIWPKLAWAIIFLKKKQSFRKIKTSRLDVLERKSKHEYFDFWCDRSYGTSTR